VDHQGQFVERVARSQVADPHMWFDHESRAELWKEL
jgi:hypothetical protein